MENDAVLFANEAFYRAFAARDLAAMDDAWSKQASVVCIHPGWAPLFGRAAVMESWKNILANPSSPAITCHNARAYVHGEMAFVVCFEGIGREYLVATNLFVRQSALWKLVHHQAGPTAARPVREKADEQPNRPN